MAAALVRLTTEKMLAMNTGSLSACSLMKLLQA